MKLGSKGQIAIAAAILVTAIVGVFIVDQVAAEVWVDTQGTNESLGIVNNLTTNTIANSCLTAAPTSVYDWTNGTEIGADNYTVAPGVYPNRASNVITWEQAGFFAHNNTTVGVNYTYGCNYGSNSTFRLIMEYLAVIVGVLLLTLAGGWLYLKGGF